MNENVDSETLVYWVVLEKAPVGIREVQRSIGFGSPSTAFYHLERLTTQGLVRKDRDGKYCIAKFNKRGILRAYILLGRRLIPKSLVYAVALSITVLFILFLSSFRLELLLTLIPALLATVIFWYETYDLIAYKKRLFKRRSNP